MLTFLRNPFGLIILSGILSAGTARTANAEVHVEGTVAAVRLTTNNDAIRDVLVALRITFNVSYRTLVPLDRTTSSSYAGPLGHVTSRLLDGYDYVIGYHHDRVEIIVLRESGRVVTRQWPRVSPHLGDR